MPDCQPPNETDLMVIACRLRERVAELARRVRPFPKFPGSGWLEAMEVEPVAEDGAEAGCVVVGPDGTLQTLELAALGGPDRAYDAALVGHLRPLDLPPEQYIPWAEAAIRQLEAELERRGIRSSP